MKRKVFLILIVVLIVTAGMCIGGYFFCGNKDKVDTTKANTDFIINDNLEKGNGKKVKVFLLAGQSNASGASHTKELKGNISEEKFSKYETGYNDIYINYYNDNGNNASLGFTKVKLNQGCADGFFGPELGIAEKLDEFYPDETIFIIKYAWGGSNLHTQWDSKYGNIYKAFIKFTKESLEYLNSKNYNIDIVAMMWMQGESDANIPYAREYENNLLEMISSIRQEFKEYIHDNMYFIDAYISSSGFWKQYKTINKAKQSICDSSSINICIDTIAEGLTFDKEPIGNPDLAHYDSLSEIKLGHLFVEKFKEYYQS